MIPLSWRIAAAGIALALLSAGAWAVHHHIYQQGYQAAQMEYQKQAEQQRQKVNDIAAQLEAQKNEKHYVYETITKQVDKIIDRPVYLHDCLDDDGLSSVNAALAGRAGKPAAAVPADQSAGR